MNLYTDLDGTIITTKSGEIFPVDNDDWTFIPNFLSALTNYVKKEKPDNMFILTNQAGIDEGYHRPKDIINKINVIVKNIEAFLLMHDTFVGIKVLVAPALTSTNRKPYQMVSAKGLMVGDASGLDFKVQIDDKNVIKKARRHLGKEFYIFDKKYVVQEVYEDPHFIAFSDVLGKEAQFKVFRVRKDFSNSDKQHAEMNGLEYMDYEDFINKWK